MDENRFWEIIDESRERASEPGKQHESLGQILGGLTSDEIATFAAHWHTKHQNAYRWDLWAVAFIVRGGCSDDSFMDFRAWLVGQGRKSYEAALDDARTVGAHVKGTICYEELNYVASSAYKKKTGEDLPDLSTLGVPPHPKDPMGTEWEEEQLPKQYPDLCKKFGF